MNDSQDVDAVFKDQLTTLLERGSFTSTYKYALLIVLVDLCLKGAGPGGLPRSFTTRQVAERLVMLYWHHTQPYEGTLLRQSKNRPKDGAGYASKLLAEIKKFQDSLPDPHRYPRLDQAREAAPQVYKAMLDKVEWIAIENPITRLQVVDGAVNPFLYTINFTVLDGAGGRRKHIDPSIETLATESGLRSSDFDNKLYLVEGVARHLVTAAPVLRPQIQDLWAELVSRYNKGPAHAIRGWLFELD